VSSEIGSVGPGTYEYANVAGSDSCSMSTTCPNVSVGMAMALSIARGRRLAVDLEKKLGMKAVLREKPCDRPCCC